MNARFDKLGNETASILTYLQNIEAERRQQVMRDERTGQVDYDLQAQQQVQMIGNVFYNLLNHMGMDKNDPKILEMSMMSLMCTSAVLKQQKTIQSQLL